MHILQVLILGIVEGITEFLPISSTGHLILTAKLLAIGQSEFVKSFEISIQLGAVLAVVVIYRDRLIGQIRIWKKLLVAFMPVALAGVPLYKLVKYHLLGNNQVVLWALFLGGLFLIFFEMLYREKREATKEIAAVSYPQALTIGLFQVLAVIPGVSRSAASIIGGLIVGLNRQTIVEFSFLLAVPTMLAACAWDLFKSAQVFKAEQFLTLGMGGIVSFAVAVAAIKFLLHFIKRHSFIPFGIYRVLVALIFWLVIK